ncbi:MAG: hypothetical protein ACOVNU_11485 [Candidatus Kapaibacteriota bacterium]
MILYEEKILKIIINIVLIILCIFGFLYYAKDISKPNNLANNTIRIHDTIYITLPADTIILKDIKTKIITLRKVDKSIEIDSNKVIELTNNIDSLNNELSKNNAERIAEIDTIIGDYKDRLNILYFINKDKWDINMIYSERNLKQVYDAKIIIPIEHKSEFELFISKYPFLSLVISGAVGFTVGSIF